MQRQRSYGHRYDRRTPQLVMSMRERSSANNEPKIFAYKLISRMTGSQAPQWFYRSLTVEKRVP
jgi:hypothetical protein